MRSCASRPRRPWPEGAAYGLERSGDRQAPHPVLDGLENGDHAYFVHSYQMRVRATQSTVLAHADYGGPVTAIVGRDNKVGAQFHPEKSQRAGLRLISNFLRWTP